MGPPQAPASPPPPPPQIPRPPTPPRESNKSYAAENIDLFSNTKPLPTPESSHEFGTPVGGSRKKVEWSPFTDYQEHPGYTTKPASILHLPPSGLRKPPRSILKSRNALMPRDPNDSSTPSPSPTYASFAAMLESVVKQLAGEDRISRIDAYTILSGTLRACGNIPDPKALKEKMGLITQFIQRDMLAKTSSGGVDSVLVINALLLLSSLLFKPSAAESFEPEFCIFVMEHAISVFETGQASKDIISRLLGVVCCQKFSAKVMNAERVGRLITALNNIENHVKGKSIESGRLRVYSSLLKQGKSLMLVNTVWIEEMLHDMMSSSPDIRNLAINFGIEAGLSLGPESQASEALQEIFNAGSDTGKNQFAAFYIQKLTTMLREKKDSKQVPRIWIVIILFLRCNRDQLEHWEHLKPWLLIIQGCFNNPDLNVRIQACRSWNIFVFAIRPLPEEKIPFKNSQLLANPILGLMCGKISPDTTAKTMIPYRKAVVGSICNLLYYVLRPDASSAQIDRYWDTYVVRFMEQAIKSRNGKTTIVPFADGASQACLILKGLFDQTLTKWVENRAMEAEPITQVELPSLNPQWIRTNIKRILAVAEPLIQSSFSELSKVDSPISSLWNALCGALSIAGAKEIKVSNDTMNAVAQIYSMLYKLWNQRIMNPSNSFFRDFGCLVSIMITKLDVLPFVEKPLSLSSSNKFTTLNWQKTSRGEVKLPLHHLVVFICQARSEVQDEDHGMRKRIYRNEMLKTILMPFFAARQSRRTRLDFIEEINRLISVQDSGKDLPSAWEVLGALTEQAMEESEESRNSGPNGEYQLASEYRCAVKILETGLSIGSDLAFKAAQCLFLALVARVKAESGDAGVAIAVIEPLAKELLERHVEVPDKLLLSFCTSLLQNSLYPKDRQAMEAARRRLWGATGGQRLTSIDPYNSLYRLASSCLKFAYDSLSLLESKNLILELLAMIERCPPSHLLSMLEKCQEGLSCWVRDADHKLTDRKTATILCERTNNSIKKLPHHNTMTLNKLNDFISSGLECRHAFVANAAVEMWNLTFGDQESLEYPSRVLEALARLRPVSELKLPSFLDTLPIDCDSAAPIYFDSQDYDETKPVSPEAWSHASNSMVTPRLRSSGRKAAIDSVVEANQSKSRKRALEGSPEPIACKRGKSTPRFRHDDSQIQFAPVESSTGSDIVMESQLLTDRQKEVKERQKADAAIFSNFGSSPIFKKAFDSSAPFSSLKAPLRKSPTERQSTPIINSDAPSIFDDDIRSSPTPRNGNAVLPNAIEPPSSPPWKIVVNVPSSQLRRKSSVVSQDYGETSFGDITVGSGGVIESKSIVNPWDDGLAQNATSNESSPRNLHRVESIPPTPTRTHPRPTKDHQSPELGREVFMNALTSPAKDAIKNPEKSIITQELPRASTEPSTLSRKTPEPAQTSRRSSQGIARNFFSRALSPFNNIKSFISPPKPKTPADTASSPLDEDSVLRVMRQFDRPEKETRIRVSSSQPDEPEKEPPIEVSFSQPVSRDDYDVLSQVYSSGGSKKRKLSHMIFGSNEEEGQQASEWDSQESWKPEPPIQDALEQPVNKLLSTIPETPARPGADASQPVSNRPYTRSLRRKMLGESNFASSVVTPQATGPDTQELEDLSRIEDTVNHSRRLSKPSIDLGELQTQDFDTSLEFDEDVNGLFSTRNDRPFASTPKSKSTFKPNKLVKSSTVLVEDSLLGNEEPKSPALPSHNANSLDPKNGDDPDTHFEIPRDRGSSPSQQLLHDSQVVHDSNENSQCPHPQTNKPLPPQEPAAEPELEQGKTFEGLLAGVTLEQHLRAVMDKLDGVRLGRNEVFELEGLLMGVKGKLFEAERRGREMSRQNSLLHSREVSPRGSREGSRDGE